MWNILRSELRMTLRQRSFYSFLILWVAVDVTLIFIASKRPLLNRIYQYDSDGREYCVVYHPVIHVNHWFLFHCRMKWKMVNGGC